MRIGVRVIFVSMNEPYYMQMDSELDALNQIGELLESTNRKLDKLMDEDEAEKKKESFFDTLFDALKETIDNVQQVDIDSRFPNSVGVALASMAKLPELIEEQTERLESIEARIETQTQKLESIELLIEETIETEPPSLRYFRVPPTVETGIDNIYETLLAIQNKN